MRTPRCFPKRSVPGTIEEGNLKAKECFSKKKLSPREPKTKRRLEEFEGISNTLPLFPPQHLRLQDLRTLQVEDQSMLFDLPLDLSLLSLTFLN